MDELRKQLKETLATVFSLYLKTHAFHWNIEGPDFYQYHKLLQKIYEDVYDSVDPIAENLRKIGAYAPGSYKRFQELTKITDTTDVPKAQEMIKILITDNNTALESLNTSFNLAEEQKQQGLMNFLADRIDNHKKWAWMLRATTKQG